MLKVYKTSYGTEASVWGSFAWDLMYRQQIPIDYIRGEALRPARRNERPSYYNDRGRSEIVERGIKFDRSGKLRIRKI